MSDIKITQIDPVTGVVTLGLGMPLKKLDGIDKLTQIVALEILRNEGRDVFSPTDGSDFRADIGQYNLSLETPSDDFKAVAVQGVKKIQDEILRDQTGVGIPSERLKSLDLIDVVFDETTGSGMVRVKITSEAGQVADIVL